MTTPPHAEHTPDHDPDCVLHADKLAAAFLTRPGQPCPFVDGDPDPDLTETLAVDASALASTFLRLHTGDDATRLLTDDAMPSAPAVWSLHLWRACRLQALIAAADSDTRASPACGRAWQAPWAPLHPTHAAWITLLGGMHRALVAANQAAGGSTLHERAAELLGTDVAALAAQPVDQLVTIDAHELVTCDEDNLVHRIVARHVDLPLTERCDGPGRAVVIVAAWAAELLDGLWQTAVYGPVPDSGYTDAVCALAFDLRGRGRPPADALADAALLAPERSR